ncbi:MAG: peptidoglycan DD-metalloendopeptidase family protein [Caldisericota bacterium]|nr:peptidoglycan DD-metalloendopeptidase family protein [Caldisericota bacterium]
MKKILVIFLIFFALLALFPHTAYSDLDEEQKKLERYKIELEKIKKAINDTDINEKTAQTLLNSIYNETDKITSNIIVIQNKINVINEEITEAENMIQQKTQDILRNEDQIKASINLAYKLTAISPIKLLLTGQDPDIINQRIAYLSYISLSSKTILDKTKEERELLAQRKEDLIKNREYLDQFLSEKWKQQEVLKEEIVMQNQLIGTLEARKIAYTQKKSEIEKEIEKEKALIEKLIREAAEASRVLETGLIWPVKGSITSYFGWRIHPIWGVREFHEGIDIAVPTNTKVLAAASGSVTYAGWMTGYGNVVILYHGSNISTLYAHLKRFAVKNGDLVAQGQVIGYADSTGWSTGPHLHFGVYLGVKAVDPLKYLYRP